MIRVDGERVAEQLCGLRKVPLPLHGIHRGMLLLPELHEPGSVELGGGVSLSKVGSMRRERCRFPLALRDFPKVISRKICPRLRSPAEPAHFQAIDLGRRTQPDMQAMAILRQVRRTADGAAQWDSGHPGDHRGTIAKSQRGPTGRDMV